MSFSFGFSGDDVGDDHELVADNVNTSTNAGPESQFVGLPAEEHALGDLVGTLVCLFCFLFSQPATTNLQMLDHLISQEELNILV
jgi:hypothetical protein